MFFWNEVLLPEKVRGVEFFRSVPRCFLVEQRSEVFGVTPALTPTLSPKEREKHSARLGEADVAGGRALFAELMAGGDDN